MLDVFPALFSLERGRLSAVVVLGVHDCQIEYIWSMCKFSSAIDAGMSDTYTGSKLEFIRKPHARNLIHEEVKGNGVTGLAGYASFALFLLIRSANRVTSRALAFPYSRLLFLSCQRRIPRLKVAGYPPAQKSVVGTAWVVRIDHTSPSFRGCGKGATGIGVEESAREGKPRKLGDPFVGILLLLQRRPCDDGVNVFATKNAAAYFESVPASFPAREMLGLSSNAGEAVVSRICEEKQVAAGISTLNCSENVFR